MPPDKKLWMARYGGGTPFAVRKPWDRWLQASKNELSKEISYCICACRYSKCLKGESQSPAGFRMICVRYAARSKVAE